VFEHPKHTPVPVTGLVWTKFSMSTTPHNSNFICTYALYYNAGAYLLSGVCI